MNWMKSRLQVILQHIQHLLLLKRKKKKRKKSGFEGGHKNPDVLGYSAVNEELSQQDVGQIKKIIKGILNDMFRDIWLKEMPGTEFRRN
mgnify:CR=1 FL=1